MEENELKAMAAFIIEKSQLSNFAEVQMTKNSIGSTQYLDFVYNEAGEGIKTIGLQSFSKTYQLATYQTSATVTREQISDLKGLYGIDVLAMVQNALVNESAIMVLKKFKEELDKLATLTYLATYTKFDKFKVWLYKIFKKEYVKVFTVKTSQALLGRIITESQRLNSISRRGHVDYIIVNSATAAILMDLPSYTMKPIGAGISNFNGTVYEAGSVAGLRVFVDPYMEWKNSTIYLGRKVRPDETGIQVFFNESVDAIQVIEEKSMTPRINIRTRMAIIPVGWYPQNQYSKIVYKYKGK